MAQMDPKPLFLQIGGFSTGMYMLGNTNLFSNVSKYIWGFLSVKTNVVRHTYFLLFMSRIILNSFTVFYVQVPVFYYQPIYIYIYIWDEIMF